jgi:hypothetical protein
MNTDRKAEVAIAREPHPTALGSRFRGMTCEGASACHGPDASPFKRTLCKTCSLTPTALYVLLSSRLRE